MDNNSLSSGISMEQRLDFWRMAILRIGRTGPVAAGKEIKPLLAMIDSGAIGEDLIAEHGATLITYAMAHWPSGEYSHWNHAYDGDNRNAKPADLLAYQPGQSWKDVGAHAPLERVVAALMHAGADPWRVPLKDDGNAIVMEGGKTYPPLWFALREDDLQRASFHAFVNHPSCPPIHELVRHQDGDGSFLPLLAAKNHPEALAVFLDRGMDPNMLDSKGVPILFHAGTRDSVRFLIAAGANPDIVDKRGNSLEVAWGLKQPVMASTLISELPKRGKQAPPPKASLAAIIAALDDPRRNDVRSVLSAMKDPSAHRWTINGVELDLLEAVVSMAAFSPMKAKAVALEEISNKKHGWPESSRKLLHLVSSLCKHPGADKEVRDLGKKLDKKLGDPISNLEMSEVVKRVLSVHRAIMPSFNNSQLENKDQSEILYGWDFMLRKATDEGKKADPTALPLFQCMQRAAMASHRIGTYFADQMFRCMMPLEKQTPMPEENWIFWTCMGLACRDIEKPELFDAWKQTLPQHADNWLENDHILMQLSRLGPSQAKSEIDQMILDRRAVQASLPTRASPRL